jgi:hypothetical protein
VALKNIDFLISEKKYKDAADWCCKISLGSKNWEEKILIFAKEGKLEVKFNKGLDFMRSLSSTYKFILKEIFEKIPSSNPTLSPVVYEKVLNEFLRLKNYQVTIIDKLSECSLV